MMTRARGITLAVSAAVAEAVAALALLGGGPSPAAVGLALALHALGAWLAMRLLDGGARGFGLPPVTSLALVAALLLPVVGPLGLGLLLRSVGRRARAAPAGPPPVITRMPGLPAAAPAGLDGDAPSPNDADNPNQNHLGPGALAARLRFAREPAARVRAVLATRRLDGARATPLLRQGLRDRHEDVRLLAYALLEDRERQGDATIRGLLAALGAAPEPRRAAVHEQLAHAYWELCYQRLVAGELESFALTRTLEHLDAAGAAGPTAGGRWLLRARVLLRQRDPAAARAALDHSRRCGMPARTVDRYLAETTFLERAASRVAS
jgi:hypothetical protein